MPAMWVGQRRQRTVAIVYRPRRPSPALRQDVQAVYARFRPEGLTMVRLSRDLGVSLGSLRGWLGRAA